jgi:predicted transcriptional regulator
MKNLIRALLFGFLCGVVWGMVLNEREHRRKHAAQVRAFQNDPEVIALNEEWEKQDRINRWLKDAEEGTGEDES